MSSTVRLKADVESGNYQEVARLIDEALNANFICNVVLAFYDFTVKVPADGIAYILGDAESRYYFEKSTELMGRRLSNLMKERGSRAIFDSDAVRDAFLCCGKLEERKDSIKAYTNYHHALHDLPACEESFAELGASGLAILLKLGAGDPVCGLKYVIDHYHRVVVQNLPAPCSDPDLPVLFETIIYDFSQRLARYIEHAGALYFALKCYSPEK